MADYLPILVMAGLVVLFVLGSFIASSLLAPKSPNAAKQAPYECGIVPEQEPAERFPVKFYLVAMSFIVLDVEIIFLYPFSLVRRGLGFPGLIAIGAFVFVLLIPFAYLLSVGALSWGPPRKIGGNWSQRVLLAILGVCVTGAVAAAYLVPLPSFVRERGEKPGQIAIAHLKIEQITCRGKGTLLRRFV